MGLEQLGIGEGVIVIAFAIIFGGLVLALAISFGLGGRDLAKNYLEKKIKCEDQKPEDWQRLKACGYYSITTCFICILNAYN